MFWAPTNTSFQNLSKIIIGTSVLGIEAYSWAILVLTVNVGNTAFLSRKCWLLTTYSTPGQLCWVGGISGKAAVGYGKDAQVRHHEASKHHARLGHEVSVTLPPRLTLFPMAYCLGRNRKPPA